MTAPLVSVIIPTYNRAEFLDRCLEAVLGQTERRLEVILIDDHSTDSSATIIARHRERDSRLRVVRNRYAPGISGARNTGLDEARGTYLAFQDTDDLWTPTHLEDALACFAAHPSITCYSANRVNVTPDGRQHLDLFRSLNFPFGLQVERLSDDLYRVDGELTDLILDLNYVDIHTLVLPRRALAGVRFNEQLPMTNDREFVLELMLLRQQRWALRDKVAATVLRHTENTTADDFARTCQRLRVSIGAYDRYVADDRLSPREQNIARLARRNRIRELSYAYRQHRESGKSFRLLAHRCVQLGLTEAVVEFGKSLFSF